MPLGNFYTRNISVCCVQLKVILRSNLYLFLRLSVGVSVGRCAISTKLSRQCHALASSPAEKHCRGGHEGKWERHLMIYVCKSVILLLSQPLIYVLQALGRIASGVQKDTHTRVFQGERNRSKVNLSIRKHVRGVPGHLLEVEALGSTVKRETWSVTCLTTVFIR